jgi:hypothetical protein
MSFMLTTDQIRNKTKLVQSGITNIFNVSKTLEKL